MQVMLRIDVPDESEGDYIRNKLAQTWLHTDGTIILVTPEDQLVARLTYVK